MTIRRGEAWGTPAESPTSLRVVPTDRHAREWVTHQRAKGDELLPVGLGGGDLARTLGGGTPGRFPGQVMTAPVDIMRVELDGEETWAVAHVVARRSWWRGDVLLAMNAQFYEGYDVAPRSHPNDGLIDVVRVNSTMSVRARLQARRRARTGTHVPHPQIAVTRSARFETTFERPLVVWADGVRLGTATSLALITEPDALTVYA